MLYEIGDSLIWFTLKDYIYHERHDKKPFLCQKTSKRLLSYA